MLPRFEIVRRLRPIRLVAPGPVPRAPYVGVTTPLDGPGRVSLHLGGHELAAVHDGRSVALVTDGHTHASRRFGRVESADELGLTLTGPHLTAWTRAAGHWTARARRDLRDDLDVHDEEHLAGLEVTAPDEASIGGFGQLGLRDVRLVSTADGSPLREGGSLWFTATSAGPGFFDSGHTSVWRLEPATLELAHTGDLFFRRPDRPGVHGDHATHLVRDGGRWLVATSTWGDFEEPLTRAARRSPSTLRVTLAESELDLLHGCHVLDTRELRLPTDGFDSIATWDPHLVRRDGQWLVGFVSARRFFSFHPALAAGASLDDLRLVAAAPDRRATEGTTLLDLDGELVVLASDGRDGRRGQREGFPVFDLSLQQVGALDAPYPTNLPWPTLARLDDGWVLLAFNGRRAGGRLLGYGTHGDLVVMRAPSA